MSAGKNERAAAAISTRHRERASGEIRSAVIRAVKEGRLLYRDAYRLTGLHGKTFDRYADPLGFACRHAY